MNDKIDVLALLADYSAQHGDPEDFVLAHDAIVELIEALRDSHLEVMRLRDAMFRVYSVAANGGDPNDAIEKMRDVMDTPWSGDKAIAALANIGGGK